MAHLTEVILASETWFSGRAPPAPTGSPTGPAVWPPQPAPEVRAAKPPSPSPRPAQDGDLVSATAPRTPASARTGGSAGLPRFDPADVPESVSRVTTDPALDPREQRLMLAGLFAHDAADGTVVIRAED